jgi:hypothetical protein
MIVNFMITFGKQLLNKKQNALLSWCYMIVLKADNMIKKKCPYNPNCSMPFCFNETTAHILSNCNYTEAACDIVANKFDLHNFTDLQG